MCSARKYHRLTDLSISEGSCLAARSTLLQDYFYQRKIIKAQWKLLERDLKRSWNRGHALQSNDKFDSCFQQSEYPAVRIRQNGKALKTFGGLGAKHQSSCVPPTLCFEDSPFAKGVSVAHDHNTKNEAFQGRSDRSVGLVIARKRKSVFTVKKYLNHHRSLCPKKFHTQKASVHLSEEEQLKKSSTEQSYDIVQEQD